jgi:hypothetical protein
VKKEPQSDSDGHGNCLWSDNDSPNVRCNNGEYEVPVACVEVHDDSKVIYSVWLIMSYCFYFSFSVSFVALYIINTVRYLIIQKLSHFTFTFKVCYLLHDPINVDYGLSSESENGREM